jgi:fatty-acyl-CoA synthase
MCTAAGGALWSRLHADSVVLCSVPLFHVTGLQHCMNNVIYAGAATVIMSRWDKALALQLIRDYRVSHWTNIPTMVVDVLSSAEALSMDWSSLSFIGGGGASMPEAIAQRLLELTGLAYSEGFGATESISQTHWNPPGGERKQCLGIPVFDTDSRVIDPETLRELGPGETGEIISSGPQIMQGYWNKPQATAEAFIELDGKRFFRTGDLGRYDEDGYFYIVDRLKRMINAAGFKVWPAEVEAALYAHPAIQEVCVIGAPDERRGETVKAVVVLKPEHRGTARAEDIIAWARENMSAYKVPRVVEFVEALPRSGTGKIQWRQLQEREFAQR